MFRVALILCMGAAMFFMPAHGASTSSERSSSNFVDSDDGWFDVSGFLDSAYGFIPVIAPITEPAVGYGAAGALVFVDRNPADGSGNETRPNIAAIGGLATENGTRGLFAGHVGTWMEGRVRTIAAIADADVNLEFFGLGNQSNAGTASLDYSVTARGGLAGVSYRIGQTPVFVGARYALARTDVDFNGIASALPGVDPEVNDLRLAALTPSITLDTRNNFFTPTRGWYVDLSVPIYRQALGGDRDFEKITVTAMHYRPLADRLFLSVRGSARSSSNGTPFYLRPFVMLRGVQALRYQGEQAAEAELELRWQMHSRFSLVGFGGTGITRSDLGTADRRETVVTGGGGFRYLLARRHGLHMGLDVAVGPDEPILYVVFGSAWLRP